MRTLLAGAAASVAAALALSSADVCRAELSPQAKAEIDRAAERVLARTGAPSASIAVVQDGRIAYLKAYGKAELSSSRAATPKMRYAIGSISKQFTAAAILLLAEQGKLSLDEPVGKYVPRLTRGDQITIRQILSHTSGYSDHWPQDYVFPDMLRPTTPKDILDRWAKAPLDFEPGADWQYSNTGYVLAGLIVEKVSGERLTPFLQAHVFAPLHMTGVVDFDDGPLPADDARPYARFALGPQRLAPVSGRGWLFGAGELAMRPEDLARWDISEMDRSLMSARSYAEQSKSVVLTSGRDTHYSLGLFTRTRDDRRVLEHGGEVSGYTSENRIFPDDRAAIVVLTNAFDASASSGLADGVEAILFPEADETRVARAVFNDLRQGRIDRSKLTANANAYFSAQALRDFADSLAPLGEPTGFKRLSYRLRGGMTSEVYQVDFSGRRLEIILRALPDGKIEQFTVEPVADRTGAAQRGGSLRPKSDLSFDRFPAAGYPPAADLAWMV